jgi:hypothetical protein
MSPSFFIEGIQDKNELFCTCTKDDATRCSILLANGVDQRPTPSIKGAGRPVLFF